MKTWILPLALLAVGCAQDAAAPELARRAPGALAITGWNYGIPLQSGTGGDVRWVVAPFNGDVVPAQVLIAPDTVEAGRAFEVTTTTVGPSGCWREDGQTVTMGAALVVLKPYDAHSGAEACTGALVFLAHRSTVVLTQAGEWTLRVEGRRLRVGDTAWEEPMAAEKTVVVR